MSKKLPLPQRTINNQLEYACRIGDIDRVKTCLSGDNAQKTKAMINFGEGTPLNVAAMFDKVNVIEYLMEDPHLEEHADPRKAQDCALRWACRYGSRNAVDYFINKTDLYPPDYIQGITLHKSSRVDKKELLMMTVDRFNRDKLKKILEDAASFCGADKINKKQKEI